MCVCVFSPNPITEKAMNTIICLERRFGSRKEAESRPSSRSLSGKFYALFCSLFFSVCSCGKWVCTSDPCSDVDKASDAKAGDAVNQEEHFTYDDMDNIVQ